MDKNKVIAKVKEKLSKRNYRQKRKYYKVTSSINLEYDGKEFTLGNKKIDEKKVSKEVLEALKKDYEKKADNNIIYINLSATATPHTPATYHDPAEGGEIEDPEVESFEFDSGKKYGLDEGDFDFIFDFIKIDDLSWNGEDD